MWCEPLFEEIGFCPGAKETMSWSVDEASKDKLVIRWFRWGVGDAHFLFGFVLICDAAYDYETA